MNEMNELETRLRSWTPRRPSQALERRIFPQRAVYYRSELLAWLVPSTICLLMTLLTVSQSPDMALARAPRDSAMIPAALSNQSYAAYLSGSYQPMANRLDTFGWTTPLGFTSSMDSLSYPKGTN